MNDAHSFAGVRRKSIRSAAVAILGAMALLPVHAETGCRPEQTVAVSATALPEQFPEWALAEHFAAVATAEERYCWIALGAPEQGWDQFLEPVQVCTRTAASRWKKLT